jgi:hypothetical protein
VFAGFIHHHRSSIHKDEHGEHLGSRISEEEDPKSVSQGSASLAQILANHPAASAALTSTPIPEEPPGMDPLGLRPPMDKFRLRAATSPIIAPFHPIPASLVDEEEDPNSFEAIKRWATEGASDNHLSVAAEPIRPTSPRGLNLFKAASRKIKSVTSIFKPTYVPPPYASFVSHQLQRYLESINVEQTEHPSSSVKLGAVLFSDASGFTAMTQRLSKLVCVCLISSFWLQVFCFYHRLFCSWLAFPSPPP